MKPISTHGAKWHDAHPTGQILKQGARVLGSVWRKDGLWFAEAGGLQGPAQPSRDRAKDWVDHRIWPKP